MQQLRFQREYNSLKPANAECENWLQSQPQLVWLKPVSVAKARTLSQNALQWKWYAEIGKFWGESAEYAHRYCKLRFGVPILRAEHDRFRVVYDRHLKPLTYEQKLAAVEIISVSSLMTVPQAKQYMDEIVKHFAEQGLVLTQPEDQ